MNLLLADDHTLFRKGLCMILKGVFPNCKIQDKSCWQDVHASLKRDQFDLVLVDLFMPRDYSWEQELTTLIDSNPTTHICIVSGSADQSHLKTAFKAGIRGYICKAANTKEMIQALLKVQTGGIYFPPQMWQATTSVHGREATYINPLTPRQQEILGFLARGYSNKLIARELSLTENTVKRHVYNIFQLLEAKNRVEAVESARQHHLLPTNI
ncbi:response regulator transcription factor [Candidatus Albibeggiatoa sp. nov. BB20]|uniref:response regulator transcription factor n=1 Tax=Candidatus Albibeggiatoa sp. nov. BB20 TaxID=3162723 RepID=UPI003365658B